MKVKIFSNPYQSEENNKEKEKGKSSFLKGTLEDILIAPKKGSTQYTQCIQYALKGKLKQKKNKKTKKMLCPYMKSENRILHKIKS